MGREDLRDLDYDRNDRDFFERASDEIRSWFGDERAERRRMMDERFEGRSRYDTSPGNYRREYDRRPYSPSSYDRTDDYDYERALAQNRFDRGSTQGEFTSRGSFDDDYTNWRNQQIEELDRDYAEWRSENARRFDDEFTNWRSERMSCAR
ncbi:SWFGD domain-containing protein [Sphingomicrobium clamense]|uniref:SWFGD domain-containing protein n=1 Tax=Sphingomicrobium clamense TaxID=2851013 RepID=A0ABS6V7X4_9SPHN|nr:SWFGD domain-containing protein [Sphingomicrobium sp. B8]MBW0145614.1 SWFGD domain-containing protein [Sphingomicrobium sp. B8]